MAEIYEAVEAFATQVDGEPLIVGMGDTVREGHPLQVKHAKSFRLIKPKFEYTPPPPVAKKAAAAPAKAAASPSAVKAGGS